MFEIQIKSGQYLELRRKNEENIYLCGSSYFQTIAKFISLPNGYYNCWICINGCYLTYIDDVKVFNLKNIKGE